VIGSFLLYVLWLLLRKMCAIVFFKAAANKIFFLTVTLRHELKLMSQSEYYFRSTYSNRNRNSSKVSFNQLKSPYCEVMDKFIIISISVRLRRRKAISWLAYRIKFTVTVAEFCIATLTEHSLFLYSFILFSVLKWNRESFKSRLKSK